MNIFALRWCRKKTSNRFGIIRMSTFCVSNSGIYVPLRFLQYTPVICFSAFFWECEMFYSFFWDSEIFFLFHMFFFISNRSRCVKEIPLFYIKITFWPFLMQMRIYPIFLPMPTQNTDTLIYQFLHTMQCYPTTPRCILLL